MTRSEFRKLVVLAALAMVPTQPAAAITGGVEGGPLANATIMVLNDRGGVCTGIILERDVVLTAGHCVAGAGQIRLHWRERGEPVLKEPASVTLNPGYNGRAITERTRSIDLALVRLKEPLPVSFAAASLRARTQPRQGEALVVAGYGLAREGDVRTSGTYRSASLDVVEPYGPGKILLWAANAAKAGACTGDSGGPMITGGTVAAVSTWATVSRKSACGGINQGVLLAPQRGWIDSTLKGWGRTANWSE